MRGSLNQRGSWTSTLSGGSIPACAGEPQLRDSWTERGIGWVYPRVCGGAITCTVLGRSAFESGLSPRVRGSRRYPCDSAVVGDGGSIPACAGEPESRFLLPSSKSEAGLSPRVRGSPKTDTHTVIRLVRRVYPRVCGGAYSGARRHALLNRRGSIPACAGEPLAHL